MKPPQLTWRPSPVYDRMVCDEWWWSKSRAAAVRDAWRAAHDGSDIVLFTDATGRYHLARQRLPGELGGEPQVPTQTPTQTPTPTQGAKL